MSIVGRELFFDIVSDPSNISQKHLDCVRELVATVVARHFSSNNNQDFIDEFTGELFLKILPSLGDWTPDPKVHYGNYFWTIIKNTIINYLNKEERYGLDLLSVADSDYNETFHTEVGFISPILSKYQQALLGEAYAVVDVEDVDAMIEFLNSKGDYIE